MTHLRRRTILGGALGALAAPAVNAQGGKPYAGTTINGSCFQTTYFEYLKNYFPQFEEKTGIKVNFNMQAFPVYNQRTDLELSTKGSALDVCNVHLHLFRPLDRRRLDDQPRHLHQGRQVHAGRLGRRRISPAARNRR